jgi:AraC family transcriptional regulator
MTDSWILHAQARAYHWQGNGQLSIKTFFGGRAHYRVGSGHHAVDESSYLVLNDGQNYEISIEARQPVESFCVFFGGGLVEDVSRGISRNRKSLLDDPHSQDIAPARFFEKNYTHDQILSPALLRLRRDYKKYDRDWLIEQLHYVAERLLRVHSRTCDEAEGLGCVRAATREELYRRVCRARDYISAMFAEPLTLGEVARTACLSPNHLLRSFRDAFGSTPHQFLTERRLQEARRLLSTGEFSVTETCFATGFESLGSFSTLFRKRHGVPPSRCLEIKK